MSVALLDTKLEAFAGRGGGDFLASPDFEDIVVLIDGREELLDEVVAAPRDLQTYVASELLSHLAETRARQAIAAHLESGGAGGERAQSVVIPRFERLIGR